MSRFNSCSISFNSELCVCVCVCSLFNPAKIFLSFVFPREITNPARILLPCAIDVHFSSIFLFTYQEIRKKKRWTFSLLRMYRYDFIRSTKHFSSCSFLYQQIDIRYWLFIFSDMAGRGPQTKVQKVMVQPINLIFRYLQNRSRIQVWLYEQATTRIEGYIIGFDEYMNLVLDDAEEISLKKSQRKKIGRILLKGDNISLIQQVQSGGTSTH